MITHSELVTVLVKSKEKILEEVSSSDLGLIHMIMGISGEVGELLDAVKKHVIYHKDLDRKNVIEELGDIEFYLEGFRQELGITREETLSGNIEKLSDRFKGLSYSDSAAIKREDKKETPTDPFKQGETGYLSGLILSDNPFSDNTDFEEWLEWNDGWYYQALESTSKGTKIPDAVSIPEMK